MLDKSVKPLGNNIANTRSKILDLEHVMKAMPEHQIHIEPKHYFAPGLYMREIMIPKGATLTGQIHLTEHLCILSKGEVKVMTENGIVHIKASSVVHSMPGMKRVLHAIEESVWINVHYNPTNETDVEKIEDLYVVDTYEKFYLETKSRQLKLMAEFKKLESTEK